MEDTSLPLTFIDITNLVSPFVFSVFRSSRRQCGCPARPLFGTELLAPNRLAYLSYEVRPPTVNLSSRREPTTLAWVGSQFGSQPSVELPN
jgi:hypothetical protein